MRDQPDAQAVAFARVLRAAGLDVPTGSVTTYVEALVEVGVDDRDGVYWAGRATLVKRPEDIAVYDRAFGAFWLRDVPFTAVTRPAESVTLAIDTGEDATPPDDDGGEPASGPTIALRWSGHEVLRHKDFAAMTAEELNGARALIAAMVTDRPTRRSHRLQAHRRGRVLDMRRLARDAIATGGDPVRRRFRRRTQAPRKLVVLCDVSGSMEPYTRALLLYLHAMVRSGRGVEVFAFGTRLTRLTAELRTRDPEVALARAAERVVDWASGTRIGASLKRYNDVWGRLALTRGAVVLIASDGWERQDHELVGREMARLHRAAYAVVWVNPVKGSPDYQPLAAGMRAALPSIDRFVAGHNLASLEALAGLLARIERRHGR
jgi:uncharacterized protein with von Willebrand factor type A (vWA) domain